MNGGVKSANGRAMRFLFGALSAILLLVLPSARAEVLHADRLTVCAGGDTPPPANECAATDIDRIDPQGRALWIRGSIEVGPAFLEGGPSGLFIAAKASSEVYLNGVRLGANGAPAGAKDLETPGRMDAVFPVPDGVLRAGRNDIAIRMSSHRGFLKLRRPVHWIALGPYADPTAERLRTLWPSLIALGVILSGALYFAVIAAIGVRRRDPLLLSVLSLFAAGQLIVEISRSLYPYPYPMHDLRLIAIAFTSAGFGLTLAALGVSKFAGTHKRSIFAGVAALTILPIAFASGFDAKAAFAILFPAVATAVIALRAALRGQAFAIIYTIALVAFAASILVFRGAFLDVVFFFEVAALLLVLFTAQALAQERDRREHELERARARDLEAALERAADADRPAVIRVNGAGSTAFVQAAAITHCKGAGDYVELHLENGRPVLHHGALADLEAELPAAFLRVHRSFIVNTAFVKTLTRESTGVGALTLSNGVEVPVSRRIMPRVKSALA